MIESETDKKKIVLIGPVYPFKGGISHYTGLMCRALKQRYDVTMISYSMQYPKILFRKEQRDFGNDSFKVEDTEYIINTANIPSIKKAAARINEIAPELVIIQWWHPYFAPCYKILTKHINSKVLFLCHNVFPHERFPFDRFLTKTTLRQGDYFILHSSKEAEELKSILPDAKFRINMHPTYSEFRDLENDSAAVPVDQASVILFFGFVRPYKGLKILIKAMSLIPEIVHLNIVGDFGGDKDSYIHLISELHLTDRISIRDGYVPDREVGEYFERCDAVILPYLDATQSGIAQIAFGFEKPVIATTVGGLPEVVTDGKTGVLCEPGDPDELSKAIQRFYELAKEVDFRTNIREDAPRFTWEHMVDTVAELTGLE
ncbi:MAG: glycosyltransferase family 4 protein [Lachnospiraceae bacterium]|nr:glycosyltransferase family 4 protein [Lachnospiraceae bacterium]